MLNELIKNNSALTATINGVTDRFKETFGIDNLVHTIHNNPKQGIRSTNDTADRAVKYPMGWYRIQTLTYLTESVSIAKSIGRFGSGRALARSDGDGNTNAVLINNHYFPVALSGSLTVEFLDLMQAYAFIQKAVIAFPTEMLSFEVLMPTTKWTVRVLSDGNSFPFPAIDDLDQSTSDAGMIAIEIPLTIQTRIGFHLEVAKINNYGEVTTRVSVEDTK